jgi:hypothetical protein
MGGLTRVISTIRGQSILDDHWQRDTLNRSAQTAISSIGGMSQGALLTSSPGGLVVLMSGKTHGAERPIQGQQL